MSGAKSIPFGDQYGSEVVDVGERRASQDKIVQGCEQGVSIVVRQPRLDIDIGELGAMQRVRRENRSSVVFAAVNAIRICGERPNSVPAIGSDPKT